MCDNTKKAIDFFAKPKHLNTTKLEKLQTASKPLEAMKHFATVAQKKSASHEDSPKASQQCIDAGVGIPTSYMKKGAKCLWDSHVSADNLSAGLSGIVAAKLSPEESQDIFNATAISLISKCKPVKEPTGKAMQELHDFCTKVHDSEHSCLDPHVSGPGGDKRAIAESLKSSLSQIRTLDHSAWHL